jgi:hypothetical protein
MFRNAITAAAALAMTAAPIAAQAAPQVARTEANIGESEQVRGTTLWIVVALVAGGLLIIFWDDIFGDDDPDSP